MDKFLVYKASGGLAHSLGGLWRAINIAKTTNRFLIIDFRMHKAFLNDFSVFFYLKDEINYSDKYDILPKNYNYQGKSINDLKNTSLGPKYTIYGVKPIDNQNDKIIVIAGTSGKRGWVSINSLKVNTDIMIKLNNEVEIKKPYISVHFRNTDIKTNIENQVKNINIIVKKTKIDTLYIASDDYDARNKFRKFLPNMDIIMMVNPERNVRNIHYGSKDKYKQIYECLRDIYKILKSNYFVPCLTSGLSRMIIVMICKRINMFDINSICIPILPDNFNKNYN